MCLAIPGRILTISEAEPGFPIAEVDFGPTRRPAQLLYVPEARVGDFVIVQAGFAIRKVGEAEASRAFEAQRSLPGMAPGASVTAGHRRPTAGAMAGSPPGSP